MAQQTISIGSTANDGTGDSLRVAFNKINSMFTELYGETAADSQISFSGNKISSNVSNEEPSKSETEIMSMKLKKKLGF